MIIDTTLEGKPVELFVLSNGRITAKVITLGAIVTELHVPDRRGAAADVVLGFDSLDGYLAGHPYFGAVIGRVANRIAGARFTLDGRDYVLAANDGPHALHGGPRGFDKAHWEVVEATEQSVTLSHLSADGDEGYPGNLLVRVTYTVTADDALMIEYEATTDRATPVNLTSHCWFNLAGPASGPILGHELTIEADRYTPVDAALLPTGELAGVGGTPFDFRKATPVGERIAAAGGDPGGYDHNFVLRGGRGAVSRAARLYEPSSGRAMEVLTTEPGLQLYTGNFLDGSIAGKGGAVYRKHQGLCLEAQHFPDALHHDDFPSIVLRPDEKYSQKTLYAFSAAGG